MIQTARCIEIGAEQYYARIKSGYNPKTIIQ